MPKKTTSKKPAPPARLPTIQFVDSPPTEQQLASSKAVQIGVIDYPRSDTPARPAYVAPPQRTVMPKDGWEVGTIRDFAKFVGMTDQQFRRWRKANLEYWEPISGSRKIRCYRPALEKLRST